MGSGWAVIWEESEKNINKQNSGGAAVAQLVGGFAGSIPGPSTSHAGCPWKRKKTP